MKVAVIIDTWFPFIGGGQINAYEISRRLAKGKVTIDIITRNNGRDNRKYPQNLRIVKLGPPTLSQDSIAKIFFNFRAFFYLIKHNYDLVHAHAFLPGITARLVMVLKCIPTVLTVHGTSINTNLNNIFSQKLEKFILTEILYSVQITVSRDFLKIKNINRNIYYIPNGIDVEKFDKMKNLEAQTPILLFVGRLHPQKNLIKLLEAFEIIVTSKNMNLLIVGTGSQLSNLKRKVAELKIKDHIHFLGQVTGRDLTKIYKSARLFILPSIYEGQPLTLLEAWAAKIPVIATRTGDCQFLIKNGKNGYLINDPRNINEIAAVIEKALDGKNLARMGQNGYNLVRKNFSWEKSAQETLKVYESLN